MTKKTSMEPAAAPRYKRGAPPRIMPRFGARKPGRPASAAAPSPAPQTRGDGEGDEVAPDAVAELEAVIGAADEEEAPEKREAEEPSNFLAMYFRDMARLAVLRPQEEFDSA